MSYRIIEPPHEQARQIFVRHFQTPKDQRWALGIIAGLLYDERATPDSVRNFLAGHPDAHPNLASGILAACGWLSLHGALPTDIITARVITGQPKVPVRDMAIGYRKHEPEPEGDKQWDFVKTGGD